MRHFILRGGKRLLALLLCLGAICGLCGCSLMSTEEVKLRDLDFTILGEEMVPQELAAMIEERKADAFKMTYSDNENLYICVGYGQQETGGYSITVDELYLTEEAVHVQTTLLGPDVSEKGNKTPSYPYVVIKTEYLDLPVICK
ncbi:MAG: protease complex subunit PrcB family protein [Lachnospiraceae bacterium]|nr:protease complex subunit PrcB family protein [Lachnospiraceae bacterium]